MLKWHVLGCVLLSVV